ncbi:UDP-glucose 4-epimerase family protein [Geomonas agri]|uniref:UDP-glucose 4-epimerase family protein n=1 Tax=Geomonas agri TaxID=2873702 RepID=UPI001CD3E588|nr:SDR family oxidoreductase [Geomonas agri]
MNRILVTGATGFVGRYLCERLVAQSGYVRGTVMASENPAILAKGVEPVLVEPLGAETCWSIATKDIDTIVHLAARVHIMNDPLLEPLAEFRNVNTVGTMRLATEAVKAGVKRFVFVSSIKVNGEESIEPYTEDSTPQPSDPYGVSKYEAEQQLRQLEARTDLDVVVVRPTLVYGPGVRANFLSIMKAVSKQLPLPLASIQNKRSFIYVENLVDSLVSCINHPTAAGRTYLVSDGEDVSTPELIRRIAAALGVNSHLVPFPLSCLHLLGRMTGQNAQVARLTGSLTVDCLKIREDLGWDPPYTMDQGLGETATWFKSHMQRA